MDNNTPEYGSSALNDAFSSAFSTFENSNKLETDTSSEITEEPKVEEPVQEVQQAQPEANKVEAVVTQQEEERFSRIHPDDLPEELKPVYKSLQADYTRKRQADSEKVKSLEAKISELESGKGNQQSEEVNPEIENLTEEERFRRFIQKEREAEWEKSAVSEVKTLDARLDENHPDYDPLFDDFSRGRLDQNLDEYERKNGSKVGFDYKSNLSEISKQWDSYIDGKIKSYIERQNQLAKKKSEATKKVNPATTQAPVEKSGRLTVDEAFNAAWK